MSLLLNLSPLFLCFCIIGTSAEMIAQLPSQMGSAPVGLIVCDNACRMAGGAIVVQYWMFDGKNGTGTWNTDDKVKSNLTIEQFDSQRVVIRRVELPNTPWSGLKATYKGTWKDGRLEGTVTGTWGPALLAANPRAAPNFSWSFYANIPVTTCNSSGRDAMEVGGNAIRFHQFSSALQCFVIAAKQGNGQARAISGMMYRDGIGTESNYAEAFRWFKACALQGEYYCQSGLSNLYGTGTGTARDASLESYWKTQADNNPAILRQKEESRERRENEIMTVDAVVSVLQSAVAPR